MPGAIVPPSGAGPRSRALEMNRDDVRYFLAVRAARSIKGAARALKVDHTTVSRRLAALEIALGASLFERTPDGLVETDAGRAVAPIAERMEVVAAEQPPPCLRIISW